MAESPDVVVRRWFKEVWDEGREESIDELMAPYGVAYGLPGGPIQGPTAFKPVFRMFREALGDLSIEVVRTVAEGDIDRGALSRHRAAFRGRLRRRRRPASRSTSGASPSSGSKTAGLSKAGTASTCSACINKLAGWPIHRYPCSPPRGASHL